MRNSNVHVLRRTLIVVCVLLLTISMDVAESRRAARASNKTGTCPTSTSTSTTATATATAPSTPSQSSQSSATMNGIKNFASSAMAAACSKTLLAPFDTIKTIQQQSLNGASGKALRLTEAAKLVTSRPGGFFELYAGLGVSAIGAMPSVGLYFGVYSYAKEKLGPIFQTHLGEGTAMNFSRASVRSLSVATSAAIGNTVASFSRVPYEVVKQKLQTGEYSSTFGALRHMCTNGGLRSFFPMGGIAIQMYRDIPYAIFTLLTYECLRDNWVNKGNKGTHSIVVSKDDKTSKGTSTSTSTAPWKDMVAGGFAGGVGSYLTNPMDVIKTRLQVDSARYSGNVWICASQTLDEGGPSAFLRGSVPRLIHKVPANAAFFVFYEFFRRVLGAEEVKK